MIRFCEKYLGNWHIGIENRFKNEKDRCKYYKTRQNAIPKEYQRKANKIMVSEKKKQW